MRILLLCSEPVDYVIAYANGVAAHAEVTAILPRERYAGLARWFDPRVTLVLVDWPRTRSPANIPFIADLVRRIRAAQPDLLHMLSNTTLWLNLLPPLLDGIPVVTTVHDVQVHPGDRDTARLPGWGARLMARQSDHLIVHGDNLRRAACDSFGKLPDQVHVVPHPAIRRYADLAAELGLTRDPQDDRFRVLLFGRIFAYKGLATLLRAEAMLSNSLPTLQVTIAGRGDDPMDLAHLMGRSQRYEIRRGFVPDREVAQLFTDADLVVLPYDEASQSGVLHLAATFGKPVVVTDVGELGATVTQHRIGRVVPPRTPSALAHALCDLAREHEARDQLGRNARAWSEGLNAPATIGQTAVQLYDSIVDRAMLSHAGVYG
ncbi:glycosyltransferase family 4 protein [Limimaricola variabilis]|uniref:glycosyltransferase family 4 protein n=1 Tax=Limimaricola variabilis TaxID=1492771 RepID=UPI002AC8B086|nr:glycosyltransferase family 4 protein [Limimaricola variabilis]WPY95390.1 glycosyltransferase family 4 protein [Limimaricola variabilis]